MQNNKKYTLLNHEYLLLYSHFEASLLEYSARQEPKYQCSQSQWQSELIWQHCHPRSSTIGVSAESSFAPGPNSALKSLHYHTTLLCY